MEAEQKQMRKCIVTGQNFTKSDMIRIVSFQGSDIEIDLSGKKPGRGCYVSADINNIAKLVEKRGSQLARALKKGISAKELTYLQEELPKAIEEKAFRPRVSKSVTVRIKREQLDNSIIH
jgi:predicted RNA-binding protein YlxR (DUF448 family)